MALERLLSHHLSQVLVDVQRLVCICKNKDGLHFIFVVPQCTVLQQSSFLSVQCACLNQTVSVAVCIECMAARIIFSNLICLETGVLLMSEALPPFAYSKLL